MASRFENLKSKIREQKPESPIEEKLYGYFRMYGLYGVPQYQVGKYFIDIAFPDKMLAIECDGEAYHSTGEQLFHDAVREEHLQQQGWVIERFSGSQIFKNPQAIVRLLYEKYFTELMNGQVYEELLEDVGRERPAKRRRFDEEKMQFLKEEVWDVYEEETSFSEEHTVNQRSFVSIMNILGTRFNKLANY